MSLSKLRSKKRRGVANEYAMFKQMRTRAWHAQQGRCFFCEEEVPIELITGDHFVPRYAGGMTLPGNIVAACAKCNNERNGPETNQRGKGWTYTTGEKPSSPFDVLKGQAMKRLYNFEMRGTGSGGNWWRTVGTVEDLNNDLPGVFNNALRAAFMQLTEGRAIYGSPGKGCAGPYQVNHVTLELLPPASGGAK